MTAKTATTDGEAADLAHRGLRRGWDGSRGAIRTWLASRVALMGFVFGAAAIMGIGPERHPLAEGNWVLDRFAYWDSYHFIRIAENGYLPRGLPCCDQAFFPGYPLMIAALRPLTGGSSIFAGLVISAVSGAVAAALLWRTARDTTGSTPIANNAVLFLTLAPAGIFFSIVYTEAMFLALALGAWWAGGRRRWWLAGALAAVATGVRVNGLFLMAGLLVMYAVQLRTDRRRLPRVDLLALGLPVLTVAAFVTYLHGRTGSGNAWREAEAVGWSRQPAWPWEGFAGGWHAIFASSSPWLSLSRSGDLLAVVFGLVLVTGLLWLRRWPEATLVGLNVVVIVCSTLYVSAPRYALTWFPAYLLLGELAARSRWRWLPGVAVIACVPLMVVATVALATRHWVA